MFQKMRRYEETHMLATVPKSGKYALPPQRILLHPVTWSSVGTYGTLGCFITHITGGSRGSSPFDE